MTTMTDRPTPLGQLKVTGSLGRRYDEILTPAALEFLTCLHDRFLGERHTLLDRRQAWRHDVHEGKNPDFLSETADIRADKRWRVAPIAPGLTKRWVEITGPTDAKMAINALNSPANVWLADQEDANSPTWPNVIEGQLNLFDAIRGRLEFTSPDGKRYEMRSPDITELPTIVMRPRGWHLSERHLRYIDRAGMEVSASGALVDFGLYFFHNAAELMARGHGPYFYLPKIESHLEARLWNEIFCFAQDYLGIAQGTVRATVLIETLPAAFQMEEILYELREHCAGLNAGRWDYLFSVIKTLRRRGPSFVLPDRAQVTMTVPFMRAYTELLVATCHQRGAHAIGGMSAFIPNRRESEVTARAEAQVRADKEREAGDGFDGTWVAHPDLIPIAHEVFAAALGDKEHQRDRLREDVHVTAAELLDIASAGGTITHDGLKTNVSVGLRYIESWLRGIGAAAIDNLMEDAATAEISRSQIWQWIYNHSTTEDGTPITKQRVETLLASVLSHLPRFDGDRYDEAAAVFKEVACGEAFPTFLTLDAYRNYLVGSAVDTPAS